VKEIFFKSFIKKHKPYGENEGFLIKQSLVDKTVLKPYGEILPIVGF